MFIFFLQGEGGTLQFTLKNNMLILNERNLINVKLMSV